MLRTDPAAQSAHRIQNHPTHVLRLQPAPGAHDDVAGGADGEVLRFAREVAVWLYGFAVDQCPGN